MGDVVVKTRVMLAVVWLAGCVLAPSPPSNPNPPSRCSLDAPAPTRRIEPALAVVAVDRSSSTAYASGIDVDGDGIVGRERPWRLTLEALEHEPRITDADDSVLAAEIELACRWIDAHLGPDVLSGVVAFSGPFDPTTGLALPGEPAAVSMAPLTRDRTRLRAALRELHELGSEGGTNYEAAIQLSLELIRDYRQAHPEASGTPGLIVLLTDGKPSLPAGSADREDPGDREAATRAAMEAAGQGVGIHILVLGVLAAEVEQLEAAVSVAKVSAGSVRGITGLSAYSTPPTEPTGAPPEGIPR